MNLPVPWCVWIFLALLAASLSMQWIRAKKRQQLVRSAAPARLSPEYRDQWGRIDRGFDPLFKDFRKLQILKKNLAHFPSEIGAAWRQYRRTSRLEMAVTAAMILFALSAFRVCGS